MPERYKAPYAHLPEPRRTYAGMLAALDEAVGQVVAAIDAKGLRKDTLFVFSSDNGGPAPRQGHQQRAAPGREGDALRRGRAGPGVRDVGRPDQGRLGRERALHIVDWYPTLLGLAGVDVGPVASARRSGRLARDRRRAQPSPHEAILLNATPQAGAHPRRRLETDRPIPGADPRDDVHAVEAAAPKAIAGKGTVELFNIAEDPYEKHNLAEKRPDKVAELRARYDAFAREAVAPRSAPKAAGFRSPRVWGEAD